MSSGPNYGEALMALEAAHNACFKNKTRDVLGMSHGPFSGVNVALGIIWRLETENKNLRRELDSANLIIASEKSNEG
jgi:hypothetical protein